MVRQVTPLEGFEVTLRKFERSKKGVNDYIELLVVFRHLINSLGRNKGLDEIEDVVKKVLSERDMQVEDKMDGGI